MPADPLAGRTWAVDVGKVDDFLCGLPDGSVHCCVTSPPYYGLRDYGHAGQIGLEPTPAEYVARLVAVFAEVKRVLRPDGTCWLNLGDSYAHSLRQAGEKFAGAKQNTSAGTIRDGFKPCPQGFKEKDLMGIPWRVAFALQADGWYLRQDIIWAKPNPMPESVRDRPGRAHESLFLLSPSPRYFYDHVAVMEKDKGKRAGNKDGFRGRQGGAPFHVRSGGKGSGVWEPGAGRNLRTVWTIPVARFKGAHFATFPPKLVEPCVLAGTSEKGACPACGAQAVRVVERTRVPTRPGVNVKYLAKSDGDTATAETMGWNRPQVIGNRDPRRHVTRTETVGWRAGCGCGEDLARFVPAVVIDPFAGSGTTLAVAVRHGRRAIGCDLNPEYADLARRRVASVTPNLPEPP